MAEKITICGSEADKRTWIYKNEDGIYIREADIPAVSKGKQKVEIIQIADIHFNYTNEKDEENEEVMLTKKHRMWNKDGQSIEAAVKAMDFAKDYDQTIITGDVLDFLSYGAMELMDKYIWDVDPNVIVTTGGHEYLRQMQTGVADKTSVESRIKILEEYWRHDMWYLSRVIKDSVMVVQFDNNWCRYVDNQVERFRNDLKIAREKGYTVLIFQHEPISTGKPEDAKLPAIREYDGAYNNFYDRFGGYPETADKATAEVYSLITENADIVRGIFCGHMHSAYYCEVVGSYINEAGEKVRKDIPQYVLEACVYDDYAGHLIKITVE